MQKLIRCLVAFGLICPVLALGQETVSEAAPSDAECEGFGRAMAASINHGDPLALVRQTDFRALGERAYRGLAIDDEYRKELLDNTEKYFRGDMEKGAAFWKSGRFAWVADVNGEKHVLIRVLSAGYVLGYFEYVCARNKQEGLKVVDCLPYRSGEWMSEYIRCGALPALVAQKKMKLEQLTSAENSYVAHYSSDYKDACDSQEKGDFAKVSQILEAFPRELQLMPCILFQRLKVALALDKPLYLHVVDDWEKVQPINPSLDLLLIEALHERKDFDGACKRTISLQKRTGADGVLEIFRAMCLQAQFKYDEAHEAFEHAIALEPSLDAKYYGVWIRMECSRNDWVHAVEVLNLFDTNFHYPYVDIWKYIGNTCLSR